MNWFGLTGSAIIGAFGLQKKKGSERISPLNSLIIYKPLCLLWKQGKIYPILEIRKYTFGITRTGPGLGLGYNLYWTKTVTAVWLWSLMLIQRRS